MKRFALLFGILFALVTPAKADNYAVTLGSGATFSAKCVGGSGAACTGGVFWPFTVIANSAGTEIFTSSTPGQVTGANGTFPATQSGTWNINNISGTVSLPTGAATAANQATQATKANQDTNSATTTHTCSTGGFSELGCLGQIDDDVKGPVAAGTNQIGNVGVITPAGATALTASATGTTGATTATLAGTSGKTTYICWMSIRANATAAATGNATVTGTITGTLNFTQWTTPNASGLGVTEMIFNPCVPASATNTGIAVVSAAPGTGGVVSVSAGGYQL